MGRLVQLSPEGGELPHLASSGPEGPLVVRMGQLLVLKGHWLSGWASDGPDGPVVVWKGQQWS